MEVDSESEVQVASVAFCTEETTLIAGDTLTQETDIVEMNASKNKIEFETSNSEEVSVSITGSEVSVSVNSEPTSSGSSQSVTKIEEEIVRESNETVEDSLKTQETSEQPEQLVGKEQNVVNKEQNVFSEADAQSSESVTQGENNFVMIKESQEISDNGSKVFKTEVDCSSNVKSIQTECSTTIVITDSEQTPREVQQSHSAFSFVSTKEIVTNGDENEEKVEIIEDKSNIEMVHAHEEYFEETKEIIESNQCIKMQVEEQTSLEVGKNVSDEKIICQVNGSNDADEVKDTHDGGEGDEQSATPDLIKACNEINKTMSESASIMEVSIKIIHCHSDQYVSLLNTN